MSQSVQTTNVVESESEDRTNGSVLSLTQSAIIEASSLVDVVSSYEILIFEICCYPNSNLANVAIQAFPYGALIVRCTESSPLEEFQDQTIRTLSAHHRAPNRFSYIHISLPCTGGSSLQNLSDNEALKSEHAEKFFALLAQCKPILKLCSLWTFELPKRSTYWKTEVMKDFITHCGVPIFCNMPKLCACGGPRVAKSFLFISTHPGAIQCLRPFTECEHSSHESFNASQRRKTGRYPELLVNVLMEAIRSIHQTYTPKAGSGYVMYHPTWEPPAILYTVGKLQGFPIEFEHASSFGATL